MPRAKTTPVKKTTPMQEVSPENVVTNKLEETVPNTSKQLSKNYFKDVTNVGLSTLDLFHSYEHYKFDPDIIMPVNFLSDVLIKISQETKKLEDYFNYNEEKFIADVLKSTLVFADETIGEVNQRDFKQYERFVESFMNANYYIYQDIPNLITELIDSLSLRHYESDSDNLITLLYLINVLLQPFRSK